MILNISNYNYNSIKSILLHYYKSILYYIPMFTIRCPKQEERKKKGFNP